MTQPPRPGEALDPGQPPVLPLMPPTLPPELQAMIASATAGSSMQSAPPRPRHTGRYIGLALVLVGLGALAARAYLLHGKLELWQYAWLTLPVAAVAAFIAYRLGAGQGLGLGSLVSAVVGAGAASYLTGISSGAQTSNSLFNFDAACLLQKACTAPGATESPVDAGLRIVNTYWQLYGATGFISAAAAGAVFGLGAGLLLRRGRGGGRAF